MKVLGIQGLLVFLVVISGLVRADIAQDKIEKGAPVEERVIRMAYNKLNALDLAERITSAKRKGQELSSEESRREGQRSISFTLRDFRIGNIEEIQNRVYRELVTPPIGEIIQASTIESMDNGGETRIALRATWVEGQYSSGFDPKWTVADVMQLESVRFHDVGRYASYEVTVSLNQKSRTYRALALFHNRFTDDGNLNPEILDSIVGMGGLVTRVLKDQRLPVGMRMASEKENPSLSSVPKYELNLMCAPDDCGGTCLEWYYTPIDPTYTFCMVWEPGWGGGGGGGGGCESRYNATLHPQVYETDTNFHVTGNHHARTRMQSVCQQTSGCLTTCDINLDTAAYADSGTLDEYLYYHVGGSSVSRRSNSGGQNTAVSCETAMGYAFKRCLVDCGVSVTVGISGSGANASVTVSGGDLWNVGHIRGRTCQNGQ